MSGTGDVREPEYIASRYNTPVPPHARRRSSRTSEVDYWTLAELRYHIRRFLRLREVAARSAGVEPQQYLLLLQVKALTGRQPVTISALAERVQLRHHSVVELVDRLAERGMVARRRDRPDRREVLVALRPRGEAVLRKLALYSLRELRTEGPALMAALNRLIGPRARARQRRRHVAR
jgi:DNA-binding MarR family transcriptional regulator